MPDSLKEFRVQFLTERQSRWLIELPLSVSDMAQICACSERTIRDWKREKFSMKFDCLQKLCVTTRVSVPQVKKIPPYAHTSRAGKKGGVALIKKYGRVPTNEKRRRSQWEKWWYTTGKYKKNSILISKPIYTPRTSAALAEFVGIMMGDGTVSMYHSAITLNAVDDAAYSEYVVSLVERLFKIKPSIYERPEQSTKVITVSRKQFSEYLVSLGLPLGNKIKNGLVIPEWIKKNKQYAIACVRGLIDTDGSVFTHCYHARGKKYCYKKISFSSASASLCTDVVSILTKNGINVSNHGRNVRIENKHDVALYMRVFGTSNPKHLKRYMQ